MQGMNAGRGGRGGARGGGMSSLVEVVVPDPSLSWQQGVTNDLVFSFFSFICMNS